MPVQISHIDFNKIKDLYEECFDTKIRIDSKKLEKKIISKKFKIIVLKSRKKSSEIIGFCIYNPITDRKKSPNFIFIEYICLSPKYQGSGLGTKFLNYCIHHLQKKYQSEIFLDCENKLVNFYQNRGFHFITQKTKNHILLNLLVNIKNPCKEKVLFWKSYL